MLNGRFSQGDGRDLNPLISRGYPTDDAESRR